MRFLGKSSSAADAIRAFDWESTSLGTIEQWPRVLKTTLSLIINSRFPQCIVWGPDLITLPNDAFLPILGDKPAALGSSFSAVWSEVWHEIEPILRRALAGEATYIENYQMTINRFGKPETAFFTFCYSPIRDENGTILGVLDTVTEATRMMEAERQLKLLNSELGHRLKNALTVTQAISLQTMRRANDLVEARKMVGERLAALGYATDVLTSSSWEAADLETLARATLTPHGLDRFTIKGPPTDLGSRQAVVFALALHELATNAVKYGALSNDRGVVELVWEINFELTGAHLVVRWTEMGGPLVQPPIKKGFGSSLIEHTLKSEFRGTAVIDFRPDGLVFKLQAPWDQHV